MARYEKHDEHRDAVRRGAVLPEDTGGIGGVAVIRKADAIPNLECRVRESVHVRIPAEHDLAYAGPIDLSPGDTVVLEGPTAHHFEELGYVDIMGVAK